MEVEANAMSVPLAPTNFTSAYVHVEKRSEDKKIGYPLQKKTQGTRRNLTEFDNSYVRNVGKKKKPKETD